MRISTSQLFATLAAPGLANPRSMRIAAMANAIATRGTHRVEFFQPGPMMPSAKYVRGTLIR